MEKIDMVVGNEFGSCGYASEGDYVHIYNLFIHPEFRRQGKARELIQTVIDYIREDGYNGPIKIVADPKDDSIPKEKLVSFYKDMGLEVYEYYGE